MRAQDLIDESHGLSAFRSLGPLPALFIVALAGGVGRYTASFVGSGSGPEPASAPIAEAIPPLGADEDAVEERPRTLYQKSQDDGSTYDTLKQTVSLGRLISHVSLASLEGERPRLNYRPMPFFDVDSACAVYPNAVRHDCVAREQRSYDAARAVWGHLAPGTIQNCANQARRSSAPRRYGALEQCVRLELARAEYKRKAFEPPPKFHYRGTFYAF